MQARQCFFLCAARKKTFARQKRSRFSDDIRRHLAMRSRRRVADERRVRERRAHGIANRTSRRSSARRGCNHDGIDQNCTENNGDVDAIGDPVVPKKRLLSACEASEAARSLCDKEVCSRGRLVPTVVDGEIYGMCKILGKKKSYT